jgi:RND family efflux transporter MFP subunit
MRRVALIVGLAGAIAGGAWYLFGPDDTAAAPAAGGGAAAGGRGGARGRGTAAMTVESALAGRRDITEYITVVGNLVGAATVDVGPRVAGRIESIPVRLGDRVEQGQVVAKVEDRELRQQVSQVQANIEVNRATVAARRNDAKVTAAALERARKSEQSGLISKAALEDAEARHNSAESQVTMAEAQLTSTTARLDELKITLSNTSVVSPVDGFVGRRNLDPGAFAGTNTAILSLVDISTVRLIANIVEKDFKRIERGAEAVVEVDAFPGERFRGTVSRVAPVFDPATRTATIEIEVANPGFRLKPGMYARVRLMAEQRPDTLTVPRAAVVDVGGRRGVYLVDGETARFRDVQTGVSDESHIEVVDGLEEGVRVVTLGALAIRDGERIVLAGAARDGGRGRAGGRRGAGAPGGAEPASATPSQP